MQMPAEPDSNLGQCWTTPIAILQAHTIYFYLAETKLALYKKTNSYMIYNAVQAWLLSPCVPELGYEPVIVVTCLDLVCWDAVCHGRSWEVDVHHKQDKARAEDWLLDIWCSQLFIFSLLTLPVLL